MFKDLITNIFYLLTKRKRISLAEAGIYFDLLADVGCGTPGSMICKDNEIY